MDEIVELLVDEKDVKAITWLGLMVDLSSSSSIRNDDFDNKLRERVLGLYLDKVVSTKDVLRVEVYVSDGEKREGRLLLIDVVAIT